MAENVSTKRVTRDVEPAALQDLVEHPSRATVALVRSGIPELLPGRMRFDAGRYLVAIAAETDTSLADQEIVLLVDDGPYWFQLRGLSVRGRATRIDPPADPGSTRLSWYAIDARRVLAWDYGTVHEE